MIGRKNVLNQVQVIKGKGTEDNKVLKARERGIYNSLALAAPRSFPMLHRFRHFFASVDYQLSASNQPLTMGICQKRR